MKTLLCAAVLFSMSVHAQSAQPFPAGLWQSKDRGFVIRIEACGTGFCGFAAAPPPGETKEKRLEICGKQMMKDFMWNRKSKRWEGRMQRPGTTAEMSSAITSDGKTFLTLTSKMLFMTKTMSFVPFKGTIGRGCVIE
jgi:uncharacterized protein (DUF2147 family)